MLKEKALKPFENHDYIVRRKAEFIFRVNIGFLLIMMVICAMTAYLDTINPELGKPVLSQQIINVLLMLSYVISLIVLMRGYLKLASHLLLGLTLVGLWFVIFFDELGGTYQYDTIVFIFAILSILPLVIGRFKFAVVLYIAANMLILIGFVLFVKDGPLVENPKLLDFLADSFMSFVILGTILYFVFSIYYDALHKAKNEIKERVKIEEELKEHQDNLEKLVKEKTQDLHQLNEELQVTNKELFEKNDIINSKNERLNKALKDLENTQVKLIRNEKMLAMGTVTLGISHEINNPLNYIMGGCYGLEDYFRENRSSNPEITDELLKSIRIGVEKASDIVKALNRLSRDTRVFTEDCDVHWVIESTLLVLQGKMKNKVVCEKDYNTGLSHIRGNNSKLYQLIFNVMSNAVDSIEESGYIHIKTEINNEFFVITIEDNGCGIEDKYLKRVVDPFFSTKDPDLGVGLGLSIAYTIIQEHNGEIEFSSEINKGTTVVLKLPINGES